MRNYKVSTIFIVLSILCLTEIAGYVVFFSIVKRNVQESYSINDQVRNTQAVQDQNQKMQQFLTDNTDSVQALNAAIIPADGSAGFIDMIESMARSTQVSIQTKSVELSEATPQEGKIYNHLKLSVSVQGSWNDVYRFLNLLEHVPYKTVITSTSLSQATYTDQAASQASTTQSESIWSGTISFETLQYKQ